MHGDATLMSSAKSNVGTLGKLGRALTYSKTRRGPMTGPCRTPFVALVLGYSQYVISSRREGSDPSDDFLTHAR